MRFIIYCPCFEFLTFRFEHLNLRNDDDNLTRQARDECTERTQSRMVSANSGVMGGKFFAARNPKGFSGKNTHKEVVEKR